MPFALLSRRRVLGAAALLPLCAVGQPVVPSRAVPFEPGRGSHHATVSGALAGPDDDAQDHVLRGRGGQKLAVALASTSSATHFHVLPPQSADALFRGDVARATRWEGPLPADGEYRIRVFLERAAALDGVVARYTLDIALF